MVEAEAQGWIGRTIDGRYAIESLVGEGGQGAVYRGRHLGLEGPIAVKILKLPSELGDDRRSALAAAFRVEAQLLHRLSRRTAGIVQALDVGVTPGPAGRPAPYIVMEWLEGESLEGHLERRRSAYSLEEAVRLLAPAATALAVAHDSGIFHLDVKPGNLFLCTEQGAPRTKVLDFGIAKVLGAATGGALVSSEHALRPFTPAYAAPEQFHPRYGARGPWTDVYALALVLVELVTGRRPLGEGDVDALFAATTDARRRPSFAAFGVTVPEPVESVVRRALEVEPVARYPRAGALWEALERALGGREQPLRATRRSSPGVFRQNVVLGTLC